MGKSKPKRILIIRMQAMGDVVITLPYIKSLREQLPEDCQIDFLTRKEVSSIPKKTSLFNRVIEIGGKRNSYLIALLLILKLPFFVFRKYDTVIDLQNNRITNLLKQFLRIKVWVSFDKYAPKLAGIRNAETIEKANLVGKIEFKKIHLEIESIPNKLKLISNSFLIVINPAGFLKTRNWPLENYLSFCRLWIKELDGNVKFVFLGTERIEEKAKWIESKMPDNVLNLVNKTSPAEAFSILQNANLVLSEDSGLMHMAWVSGVPTLALLGSTRSDWTAHDYPHTLFLTSEDLACGNCMLTECLFGDERCLTRYSPEFIFNKSKELLKRVNS